MGVGGVLIVLGIVSIVIGALIGRRTVMKHFGEFSERSADQAQMLGLAPALTFFRSLGWVLVLVGVGILIFG